MYMYRTVAVHKGNLWISLAPILPIVRYNLIPSVSLLGKKRDPSNEVVVRHCVPNSLSKDFNKLQIKVKLLYLQSRLSAVACR